MFSLRPTSDTRNCCCIALALLLLLSGSAPSIQAFDKPDEAAAFDQNHRITLEEATIRRIAGGASHLTIESFPISPSKRATIELKRLRSVIDASTVVEIGGKNGSYTVKPFEVINYRGFIAGVPGSQVEIGVVDGRIVGSIETPSDFKYIINPDWNSETRGSHFIASQASIYRERPVAPGRCEAESYDKTYGKTFQTQPAEPAAFPSNLLQVSVAIDADYNFFKSTGADINKTIAYIGTVFNFVSMIYENEVNITYRIPYIKIWTDSLQDPYKVAGNPFSMVEKVQTYWMQNNAHIERDIVHGMTSTQWGGGGYALFQTLCSQNAYGCSAPCGWLSYPTFDYTYDVYIIAHEIGHMYGALHTHDCQWNPPLDTCGVRNDDQFNYGDACFEHPMEPKPNPGSIMSYCLQINAASGVPFNKLVQMTLLEKVATVIRQGAEAASCIKAPISPTLVLRSPRGGEVFKSISPVTIEWSYANVVSVNLEYSFDGKKTWEPIASGIDAALGSYEWNVPKFSGPSKIYVRVKDKNDPVVGDTSIMETNVTYTNLRRDISAIDWGKREAGSYDTSVAVFTNTGEQQVVISEAVLVGPGANAFQLSMALPVSVQPSSSLTLPLVFSAEVTGQYIAELHVTHNGAEMQDTIMLTGEIATTGSVASKIEGFELTFSPNPAGNTASCELTVPDHYSNTPITVSIIDPLGRVVHTAFEGKLGHGKSRIPLDLSGCAAGSYLLSVQVNDQRMTLSFIKR